MSEQINKPDYLFEVSWEVCNKVGGIHTVVASKALSLKETYGKKHILIGPDVWMNTEKNPEFTEDDILFRGWRTQAKDEGLRVRAGRWPNAGGVIVILVDYTQFIAKKDEILTNFWTKFGVDSLSGQWDYIEGALFGYAAGRVIESFVKFNLQPHHKVVAQFHEWLSGAGVLYLKEHNLSIGTVFTTHATVVGRSMACNNVPLYNSIAVCDGDDKARQFNVVAKHSLEKTAAHQADVFTTVSEITSEECRLLLKREPDVITPNGFDSEIVPEGEDYLKYRAEGRARLLQVASAATGKEFSDDVFIVGISGRYEFRNKGIDLFLDALGHLKSENLSGRKTIAFLMIPAGNNGPDKELANKIMTGEKNGYTTKTTHSLSEPEYDQILSRMNSYGFNGSDDMLSVIYVPTYLNGNDGIFNTPYYKLLSGLDLSVFPSYYEPWGYTPLESLAFGIPTVTTTLAGFGLWVNSHYGKKHPSVEIIERNDNNYNMVVDAVMDKIASLAKAGSSSWKEYSDNAFDVAKIALWKNNVKYYEQAYRKALEQVVHRRGEFPEYSQDQTQKFVQYKVNAPTWKNIMINKNLPKRLEHLDTLSKNLWWCWNQEAIELFKMVDRQLWKLSQGNPIAMLDMVDLARYKELAKDEAFISRMDEVYSKFSKYMSLKEKASGPSISYFCMEYGLDTSLKIYSGGLGILAGDYLKEASDMNVRMTAVGFLYKYGYFTQQLSGQGDQVSVYDPQDFSKTPATPVMDENGKWLTTSVAFPGRTIKARIWRVDVGRVELYLLDSDIDENLPEDRGVTHQLYGGDWENRLKQELLLGIGGIRALRVLGIYSDIYHCNEGHAAFIGLERLREYVQLENLSFTEAVEVVRSSSLFTTHTPVPAGHDAFSEDMLRTYIAHYPERLKIDWNTLKSLGMIDVNNPNEKFSMSNLAANLSQEVNGVSWLHGKVSQEILGGLWPGYLPEELHVDYVTNGVHYPTWTAPEWKEIHSRVFGTEFENHHYDKSCFGEIRKVDNEIIWGTRCLLKKKLIDKVKEYLSDPSVSNHYSPHHIVDIKNTLRDDILTIGFARRFATYKRAHLLFRDLDKLSEIINNEEHPVQFLFAGKAHPADKAGQDLIKRIVEISKMPQFIGKIVFIPNYDITLAKYLVQGVDVWMNTPTRPLEASGTSGEKAAMNGVMHFSVLDGWWVEGYKKGAGWALQMERTYDDQGFQDELDAATIYDILESEIVPEYYNRNAQGFSDGWVETIKNCIADVACNFTTNRMMTDYFNKFYYPLEKRYKKMIANDYAMAREIAMWKRRMRREWPLIEVVGHDTIAGNYGTIVLGGNYESVIKLAVGDTNPEYIGLETLLSEYNKKGKLKIKEVYPYKLKECKDGVATFVCNMVPDRTGTYEIATRMYAKNSLLAHRQDFELVKWL